MKLGIGTVQFGLDYGISNTGGRCPPEEVARILARASKFDIRLLDTAAAYGHSEHVLGETLPAGDHFQVVTKLGPFDQTRPAIELEKTFEAEFEASRRRLGYRQLHGLLLHHFSDVQSAHGDALFDALRAVKDRGEVRKIGVSVYSAEQIDYVLDRYEIGLIQLPLNILDQRLIESGHLRKLRERGVEIHARSAFLQGLLLMEPETVPAYFEPIRPLLLALHSAAAAAGLSLLSTLLAYVKGTNAVDTVVVGVNSEAELVEIAEVWNSAPNLPFDAGQFSVSDAAFLNPANWPADVRSSGA